MQAETLIFDTGPLSHFARQGWLGALKAVVADRPALIPDVVAAELEEGARLDSRIQTVLDAAWIRRHELRSGTEIQAFAKFSALLVDGERNRGEAGVLALASTLNAVAVIDDGAGRKAAAANNIQLRPTLALLCEAIRHGFLTVPLVSALADDLIADKYRLPFPPGGFARWAKENGLCE